MKPLVTNQMVLTWLGLYPVHILSKRNEFGYMLFGLVNFAIMFAASAASALYIFQFATINLETVFYALMQFIAYFNMMYLMMFAFVQRNKIMALIETLCEMYEEHAKDNSIHFLVETNNLIERMWELYLKYAFIAVGMMLTTSSVASIILCWLTQGHFDVEYLYYPMKISLPWNQQTPFGYFAEILFSVVVGEVFLMILAPILLLFISICWHHRAFSNMFRYAALKLNRFGKDRGDKNYICQLIQFHVSVKEWFIESAEMFSPLFVIQLISSMLIMTCGTFLMETRFKKIDLDIAIILSCVGFSSLQLFLYCFFGKVTTESFIEMADYSYEVNWYELPVELQKYFILMISSAQKPLHYHGSNITTLRLETFSQFLKTVFSYYTLLKSLTSNE